MIFGVVLRGIGLEYKRYSMLRSGRRCWTRLGLEREPGFLMRVVEEGEPVCLLQVVERW